MINPHKVSVAIAAGGTAGHINPALSLAEELRERGADVTFFGQEKKLEGTLVPAAGFKLVNIKMKGFDRARPWTALSALLQSVKAKSAIARYYQNRKRPDVIVGFGAYIEFPLVGWAHENDIPVVLHEQNSVPGLANKLCASAASVVAYAFPQAEQELTKHAGAYTSFINTGNPVRAQVLQDIKKAEKNRASAVSTKANKTVNLLVFGGSLGAQSINEAMIASKDALLKQPHVHVLHATGKAHFEHVQKELHLSEKEAVRWKLVPYLENIGEALGQADLVLSRAGASSVAEIAAAGVPAFLVPYPHARGNHQAFNARLLADDGAALIVKDSMVKSDAFQKELTNLLSQKKRLERMRKAAKKAASNNATDLLYEVVIAQVKQ